MPDVPLQQRIAAELRPGGETIKRVVVPVQLHPHAPDAPVPRQRVELRPHVIHQHVGVGDDGDRKARPLRGFRDEGRLLERLVLGQFAWT